MENKTAFHGRNARTTRGDPEFPWIVIKSKPSIREFLVKIPYLQSAYRRFKGKPPLNNDDLNKIYEVRCLLNDQLSQHLLDEAVIIRKVSHERYFFPRYEFDPFATVIDAQKFSSPGYPDNYLGLPLIKYKILIEDIPLEVIASEGFVQLLNNWRQYFISREAINFKPGIGDTIIDCGACIGDITTIFAGLVGPTGSVHAFDPVPLHNKISALQLEFNPYLAPIVSLVPSAVGNKTTQIRQGKKSDVKEIEPGTLNLNNFDMITLDDYVESKKLPRVDYIKMDIEGFERDALSGAAGTIRKFKPKLAISTYHQPDDFWHLPLQIRDFNVGYKFAFGHHSPLRWESVIYAY